MPVGTSDGPDDVLARADNHNAGGLDLVNAGVGRIECPGDLVKPHFTLEASFKFTA